MASTTQFYTHTRKIWSRNRLKCDVIEEKQQVLMRHNIEKHDIVYNNYIRTQNAREFTEYITAISNNYYMSVWNENLQ